MGEDKSGSSDVEVEADNDSVFSDPNASKADSNLEQLNSESNNSQTNLEHIRKMNEKVSPETTKNSSPSICSIRPKQMVPSFLVSHPSLSRSPHLLINHGVTNQSLSPYQASLIAGQLASFQNSPNCNLQSLHPATFSRVEDAKSKNLLKVYCNSSSPDGKKISATLDKTLFGSGSKGACIRFEDRLLTPRQFEIECKLEQSRDWRRSIHCQGDTLKDLIRQGVLKPHAQSCACDICSPDQKHGITPKYEEEVNQRRNNKRKANSMSRFTKSGRKDIFFPSESHTPLIPNTQIPGKAKTLSNHQLFQSSLFSILDQSDKIKLRLIAEKFDKFRTESEIKSSNLEDRILICEKELQLLKESAIEEKTSFQEREYELINLLTTLTDSMEKSGRIRQSIISGNGFYPNQAPQSQPKTASLVYTDGTPLSISSERLKMPRSAPPESPIRSVLVHPDKRRTSSDTSGIKQNLQSQECSNIQCKNVAQWRCIGCEKSIYCGKDCQEMHWDNGHEDECDGEAQSRN